MSSHLQLPDATTVLSPDAGSKHIWGRSCRRMGRWEENPQRILLPSNFLFECVYLAPSSYQGSARSWNILETRNTLSILTLNYLHFNTWSILRSELGKASVALRYFSWGSLCFWSIVGHILMFLMYFWISFL